MNREYEPYHPKWYRRRMPTFWWLQDFAYTRFMGRELTSLAVAYSAVVVLLQVWAVGRGGETYAALMDWLRYPPLLVFNVLVLLALLFHSITWLNLTPKALVLHFGGRRVPDAAVLLGHYALWFVVSALLVWALLGR